MKILKRILLPLVFVALGFACRPTGDRAPKPTEQSGKKTGEQIVVDVRSPEEWEHDGHAPCSVNYPLAELETKLEELKTYQRVVFVCRSGHRAAMATEMLKRAGFSDVQNGGPWQQIQCE